MVDPKNGSDMNVGVKVLPTLPPCPRSVGERAQPLNGYARVVELYLSEPALARVLNEHGLDHSKGIHI